MYVLKSFCEDPGVLQTFYILKTAINVIKIGAPILLIVMCMIEGLKAVTSSDVDKKHYQSIVKKIIVGAIIFLIPSVIDLTLAVVNSSNLSSFTCWTDANTATIERRKEEKLDELDEDTKRAEQAISNKIDTLRAPELVSDGVGSGTTSTTGSGDYTVRYDAATETFYIPNKRATSDAHTPKGTGIEGTHPEFGRRLEQLIADAKKLGYKVTITSGHRPYSRQKQLWDQSSRSCATRSSWVACPGGSRHGFGIAADLKYNGSSCSGGWDCNAAAKWVHANASKYGLKFRMSHEPWHIEPDKIEGGGYGSCTVPC